MASASDKLDEFRATTQHSRSPSNPATTKIALCDLCMQALTIDDKLAGGAVIETSTEVAAVLDLSGFSPMEWENTQLHEIRATRSNEQHHRDEFGWRLSGESWINGRETTTSLRRFCAGNNHERCVTPPQLPELAGSTDENCQFCSRLRKLFCENYGESSWWRRPDSRLRFRMQYEWVEEQETMEKRGQRTRIRMDQQLDCLAVLVHHPGLDHERLDAYEFEVGAWPGDCRDWLKITKRPLDMNAASDANVQFMKNCITECARTHEDCRAKASKVDFVPTRLLDIGDSKDHPYVKLRERSETLLEGTRASELRYAALSYCWGKALPLKTTSKTIDQHKSGIPVHDMPATFQDAIHIISELGIRYLWIDALCIIQDSRRDWETESVKMCDIFAHAFITISAAASSSSSERFLQRPHVNMLTLPFRSSLRPGISGEYALLMDGRPQGEDFTGARYDGPGYVDLKHSRWLERAWVWQEQVMATRQLIFGERMLQFRCDNGIQLEYGLASLDASMTIEKGANSMWWGMAVSIYSRRKLTFAQDRLGAIAGAARFLQDAMKEEGNPVEYLVGLWLDENFQRQLDWVCGESTLPYNMMLESFMDERRYCAPSWTWASRDTGINFLGGGPATLFQIVGYDLQPALSDAMVAVKFGSTITLQGKCRQTPVKPISGIFIQNDSRKHTNYWKTSCTYGRIDFWLDWVPNLKDLEESNLQNQLQLFLTTKVPQWGGTDSHSTTGLLLLPFEDDRGILYRRVGVFNGYGDSEWLTSIPERNMTIL